MKSTHRVAIVTGASKGIGRAISHKLASLNMNLVLVSRDSSLLEKVKHEITDLGKGEIITLAANLTIEEEIKKIVDHTLNHFGQIDVLVNNAGVGKFKRIDAFTLDDYNCIFDVNIKGLFLLTKYVVPHLIKQKSGHIINISSIAGKNGFKSGTLYAASKHAVQGFTWSLREDIKEFGIKVTAVCPGSVLTRFGGSEVDRVEWSLEPEDVAHAIGYLVTESDFVNTAEIVIKPRYNPRSVNWEERV
ncbi:MAG: SDR family oxidoreductase [Candidatus Hodarchaeales archaeon]|jgi:short-subunit dehydrogenase